MGGIAKTLGCRAVVVVTDPGLRLKRYMYQKPSSAIIKSEYSILPPDNFSLYICKRALGLHEKVVEGIESQGLKAAVFDKVFDTCHMVKVVMIGSLVR